MTGIIELMSTNTNITILYENTKIYGSVWDKEVYDE